ncbi:acyltransferase family protein [Rheinheimera fenheensis]|uniref:acyltransferase family protein n=1 Tax=Rheinheimera fenheensis TaxID=3152295 RepID=UPI00325D54A0
MTAKAMAAQLEPRRYDLDWLRVLAFGLLIFYHTGMLYVERWGFHYKSQYLSSTLEYLMLLSSPWRMLLIWFISGYALGVVLPRIVSFQQGALFAARRTVVLLLPLLTGLWLIVPPQLYAEMLQDGAHNVSYWAFYQAFFDLQHPLFADYQSGVWPHVDVNHLWYLRSLWQFTLLLLLLLPLLNLRLVQRATGRLLQLALPWQLLLLTLMLLLVHAIAEGGSRRELAGFGFLVLGFLSVRNTMFWQQLGRSVNWLGVLCLLNYLLLLVSYYCSQHSLPVPWHTLNQTLLYLSYTTQAVAMTFWLLALAQRFLNRPHPYLALANRAVFPVYLAHQSLIIIAALYLTPLALGGPLEALLVVLFTLLASAALLLMLWRLPLIAPLFGLKTAKQYPGVWANAGLAAGLLLVLPLAIELLL